MNSNILKIIFVLFCLLHSYASFSQEVVIDTLTFITVKSINTQNDALVDEKFVPNNFNRKESLITSLKVDTSWWREYEFKFIKDWKIKNSVTDEGEIGVHYGIIKNDNGYFIKKMNTQVKYLVGEIGGGYMGGRVIQILDQGISEIVFLFDEGVILEEKQVYFEIIRAPQGVPKYPDEASFFLERVLDKNIRISYNFNHTNY